MVLKFAKYGVRSGNTLRASNSRYLRQYKRQTCLRRRVVPGSAVEQEKTPGPILDTLDVQSSNVEYSLNKKGRWCLPDLLRDNILRGEHDHEDFGVQLVEYHKVKRQANCVGFCSTVGPVRQARAGKRNTRRRRKCGYLQAASFLNMKTTASQEEEGRFDSREDENGEEERFIPTQLRYEIFYPGAPTSSIVHNPKYILKGNDKDEDSYNCRYRDSRSKRRRRKIASEIWEELSALDDDLDDNSCEEESVSADDPCQVRGNVEVMLELQDLLRHASRVEAIVSTKSKRNKKSISPSWDEQRDRRREKKHIVYTADGAPQIENTCNQSLPSNDALTVPFVAMIQPVTVVLPAKQLTPRHLEEMYGARYIECDCFPRKFIIDISEEAVNVRRNTTIDALHRPASIACVVFTRDAANEMNNACDDIYQVSINMELDMIISNFRIETMFDYMELTVEDTIRRTLFFIETLPVEAVKSKIEVRERKLKSCGTLEACTQWKSQSYAPSVRYLFDTLLVDTRQLETAKDIGYDVVSRRDVAYLDEEQDVASPKDRFCDICFDAVGDSVSATALMACSHWFCDRCWKEHLKTRLHAGAVKLSCPEYECDKMVDPGTLLSLLNVKDVIRFAKRCHDTQVEQQSATKWCPNSKCGCVLRVNVPGQKNVRCVCGKKVCFDCLGDAHWPAPCKGNSKYIKKLYDSGDIGVLPPEALVVVDVSGKNCPSCKRFIEKNGGCPCMTCVCGHLFCWGCMKDWNTCRQDSRCYRNGKKNKFGTEAYVIEPENRLHARRKQKWYSLALHHRTQQHPVKFTKIKKALPQLSKKIQNYVARAELKGEPIAVDFEKSDRTYKRESEKVPDLVRSLMDLYGELHHLSEHSAVLVDSVSLGAKDALSLQHLVLRMDRLCTFIYELMLSGVTSQNTKSVFENVVEIRTHARRSIQGLVKFVNVVSV